MTHLRSQDLRRGSVAEILWQAMRKMKENTHEQIKNNKFMLNRKEDDKTKFICNQRQLIRFINRT